MAGLACARTLEAEGADTVVLEGADRVGGRVGSRRVDGISCDFGFQVSMSNYTELERFVPRSEVSRHPFISGAVAVERGGRCRIMDPRTSPLSAFSPWLKGLVRIRDVVAVARCRSLARTPSSEHEIQTTQQLIDGLGFSHRFQESFLRPFFGGVLLDERLSAPASRFLRAFDRFAHGSAELPKGGMQSLPDAMAGALGNRVRLNQRVQSVQGGQLLMCDGTKIDASSIVLAIPRPEALKLLGLSSDSEQDAWYGTMAMHFATEGPLPPERLIHLNATGSGQLNLVCSPSMVAPGIAPDGTQTIIASLRPGLSPSAFHQQPERFTEQIRQEAGALLAVDSGSWRHLATDVIPDSLPRHTFDSHDLQVPPGIVLAGDWFANPSIDDAIESGVQAARQALAQRR